MMSKKIHLLDCTLRDGGYNNNWLFGKDTITDILTGLEQVGVEYIEVGLLQPTVPDQMGCTKFSCPTKTHDYIKPLSNATTICLINHGNYDVDALPNQKDTLIKAIRYCFPYGTFSDALTSMQNIIGKGYQLFIQPTYIKQYTAKELENMVKALPPNGVSTFGVVDSFGNITAEQVEHFIKLLDQLLADEISINLHLHDNFLYALSNALHAIKLDISRPLIIDTSICGYGRGAGNLRLEALLCALHNQGISNYHIEPLFHLADKIFPQEKTRFIFLLTAAIDCHPSYGMALAEMQLPMHEIYSRLQNIPDANKSRFNEDMIA